MNKKIFFIVILLSAFSFTNFTSDYFRKFNLSYSFISDYNVYNPPPFAVVGDLQRTSLWEQLIGREQNDLERAEIINSVKKDAPAFTVLLGDMVYQGDDNSQWAYFDTLVSPLIFNKIGLLPVVGNHEYYGKRRNSMRHVSNRFAQFDSSKWYYKTYDSLALIFLDSNRPDMLPKYWDQQIVWFNRTIQEFEADNSIKKVLVFTHHPPYTNSLVTGDEVDVQEAFLETYNKSKKAVALISGHAHTYEHFRIKNKNYIVSWGGGGPRVGLRTDELAHKDMCTLEGVRPFNYLLVKRQGNDIKIVVKGIDKGLQKRYIIEEFVL